MNDTSRETLSRSNSPLSEGHVIGACPVGFPEGQCGGELRVTGPAPAEERWARCRSCKTAALVDWWLAQMSPATHEWLPMRALRWHLLMHVGRRVSDATIRAWASDPAVLATRRTDTSGHELPAGSDTEVTSRAEYRVADALRLIGFNRTSFSLSSATEATPA